MHCSGAVAEESGETIELRIPLNAEGEYRLHDVYREGNAKLGWNYPLGEMPDRQVKLHPGERLALALAEQAGWMDVEFQDDLLLIRVPNTENDEVRKQLNSLFFNWPADKKLHWDASFDPQASTIVLVHGLESQPSDLERFQQACQASDIQCIVFDYPNDGPLLWSANRLREDLLKLERQHPDVKLAIVAHSMGGLVARAALEMPGEQPQSVRDLITLGTPHQGSAIARLGKSGHEMLEMILQPSGVVLPWRLLADGRGEAVVDLRPESQFLKQLNGYGRAEGINYHTVAGTKGFLTPEELRAVRPEIQKMLNSLSPTLQKTLRELLECAELVDGTGDGVVSVESALLDGATTRKKVACNHLELLDLPGVKPQDHPVFKTVRTIQERQQNDKAETPQRGK